LWNHGESRYFLTISESAGLSLGKSNFRQFGGSRLRLSVFPGKKTFHPLEETVRGLPLVYV